MILFWQHSLALIVCVPAVFSIRTLLVNGVLVLALTCLPWFRWQAIQSWMLSRLCLWIFILAHYTLAILIDKLVTCFFFIFGRCQELDWSRTSHWLKLSVEIIVLFYCLTMLMLMATVEKWYCWFSNIHGWNCIVMEPIIESRLNNVEK